MSIKLIIISSPSGAGKTTICKKIIKNNKQINLSISYTTRPKRLGEKEGIDYYFVNKKKFIQLKNKNFFVETANVFDHLYGTPFINIKNASKYGLNILFDIDWQGAEKIRKKYKNSYEIIDFFILPPSKSELRIRLKKRGRDNIMEIKKRMSLAVNEIFHYKDYNFVIVNENINNTVNDILSIIKYEELLDRINKKVKSVKIF